MEHLLNFFSALLIFTGGLVVAVLWIAAIILVSVEIYDIFTESDKEEDDA